MSIKRVKLDRFDGGIISSDRSDVFQSGASMVRHFDIYADSKKMYPLPSFERWATEAEEGLNIVTLGIDANTTKLDTIYGVGRGIKNWLGQSTFPYRVQLTPDTGFTSTVEQVGVSLANMPSEFWTNVDSQGRGMGVAKVETDGTHTPIAYDLVGFDYDREEGFVFFAGTPSIAEYYLYYGGSTGISHNSAARNKNSTLHSGLGYDTPRPIFHFESNVNDARFSDVYDTDSDFDLNENPTGNITYTSLSYPTGNIGLFASATTPTTIESDDDGVDYFPDFPTSALTVSFNIYLTGLPTSDQTIISAGNIASEIEITTGGNIKFNIDRNGGSVVSVTGGTALSLNTLYRVRCEYGSSDTFRIFLNGVEDVSGTAYSQSIDFGNDVPAVQLNMRDYYYIQNLVFGDLVDSTGAIALQDYKTLFANGDVIDIGSEEELTNATLEYRGLSVYEKSIDASSWSDTLLSGYPIRIDSNTPVNDLSINEDDPQAIPGFIRYNGTGFLGDELAFYYSDSESLDDPSIKLLTLNNSDASTGFTRDDGVNNDIVGGLTFADLGIVPTGWEGIDGLWYFSNRGSQLYYYSGGDVTTSFVGYPITTSLDNYSGYLVVGGFKDNKSFVQLWDRSATAANQFIDFGLGKTMNVGVIKGDIVAVVNGFIDNTEKSVGDPYMEVRRWVGGTTYDTPARITLPTTIDNEFSEYYLNPVHNKKVYAKNAMLFYAKLPSNEAGTEFNEGFWAVGKNELTDKLSLSLFYDTSNFPDRIYDYITSANNLYVSSKTNDKATVVHKMSSDTYTQTSSFETLQFDDGLVNTTKKLYSVEVSTEPLTDGQEVSLYYCKDNETSWTKIGTFSDANEIGKEFTRAEGDYLPNFKQIKFKIESVGGGTPITEFAFRYQNLTDRV